MQRSDTEFCPTLYNRLDLLLLDADQTSAGYEARQTAGSSLQTGREGNFCGVGLLLERGE